MRAVDADFELDLLDAEIRAAEDGLAYESAVLEAQCEYRLPKGAVVRLSRTRELLVQASLGVGDGPAGPSVLLTRHDFLARRDLVPQSGATPDQVSRISARLDRLHALCVAATAARLDVIAVLDYKSIPAGCRSVFQRQVSRLAQVARGSAQVAYAGTSARSLTDAARRLPGRERY